MDAPILFTTTFKNTLIRLCKKATDGYTSCKKDICDLLDTVSFEELWISPSTIKHYENIIVKKIRVQNSQLRLSKKDGYRLIILCNKKYNDITLLTVYPKQGRHSKENQTDAELEEQITEYMEEYAAKTIESFEVTIN